MVERPKYLSLWRRGVVNRQYGSITALATGGRTASLRIVAATDVVVEAGTVAIEQQGHQAHAQSQRRQNPDAEDDLAGNAHAGVAQCQPRVNADRHQANQQDRSRDQDTALGAGAAV